MNLGSQPSDFYRAWWPFFGNPFGVWFFDVFCWVGFLEDKSKASTPISDMNHGFWLETFSPLQLLTPSEKIQPFEAEMIRLPSKKKTNIPFFETLNFLASSR